MANLQEMTNYANLAVNVKQSLQLGEISNQLNQLTTINTAMLGGINNLVNIEVYKLEKEEEEKDFKQLIFNLNKFLKNKYEDTLTICLFKYGHCGMIKALLNNFQKELKSFEDKDYVENIIDNFEQYSSIDVDLEQLTKTEDDAVLLVSYLLLNGMITSNQSKIEDTQVDIEKVRRQNYTPMKKWTFETLNKYLEDIGSTERFGESMLEAIASSLGFPMGHSANFRKYMNEGKGFQIIFKDKKLHKYMPEGGHPVLLKAANKWHNDFIKDIEENVLPALTEGSRSEAETLSKEINDSLMGLSDDIKKSSASWISVEKNLINMLYDTNLPIHEPYQYRKQVIGD